MCMRVHSYACWPYSCCAACTNVSPPCMAAYTLHENVRCCMGMRACARASACSSEFRLVYISAIHTASLALMFTFREYYL